MIPFLKFIQILGYKCQIAGIKLIIREESYTSKCSALDNEDVGKCEIYLGKRHKRGMFITSTCTKINADLNGAINILRKESPDKGLEIVQSLRSRGQVAWPVKINLH